MFTAFTKLEEMLKKRFMEACLLTQTKLIENRNMSCRRNMFTTFTKLEEMLKKIFMETCSLTLAKLKIFQRERAIETCSLTLTKFMEIC